MNTPLLDYYKSDILSSPVFQLDIDRLHAIASGDVVGDVNGLRTLGADTVVQNILLGYSDIYVCCDTHIIVSEFWTNHLLPILCDVYGFDFRVRDPNGLVVVLNSAGDVVANIHFVTGHSGVRRDHLNHVVGDRIIVDVDTTRWPTYPNWVVMGADLNHTDMLRRYMYV